MSKGRILLVDDEFELLKALALRLSFHGYEVMTAMDGYRAMDIAFQEQPDLIILDVGMPEINGHEVARFLRGSVKTSGIPIIYLTGHTTVADHKRAAEEKIEHYITKPYQPDELLAAVNDSVMKRERKSISREHTL
jgi:two-component system phosphate regulon response regulator PhoB